MYVLRSGAFMQTDKKIDLVRQLLLAFRVRNNETGIQWAKAFNREEGLRRQLDPSGQLYDRNRVMRVGTQRKLQALPNAEGLPVEKIEELVSVIAPNAVSKFDGVLEANVRGAYKALKRVTELYPEVSVWLKQFGSIGGLGTVEQARINELLGTMDDHPDVKRYKQLMENWKANEKTTAANRYRGYGAWWVAKYYSVAGRAPVKKWLREHGSSATATVEFFDLAIDLYVETRVQKRIKETAKKAAGLPVPKDDSGMLACAWNYGNGVWIGNKLGSRENFDESMIGQVARNWHPPFDEDCGGAMSVIVHEFGHVLDFMTDASEDPEILKIWRKRSIDKGVEISNYAKDSCCEMIAEAFAEYHTCKNPRPLARRIGERIAQLYTEKYGELIPEGGF